MRWYMVNLNNYVKDLGWELEKGPSWKYEDWGRYFIYLKPGTLDSSIVRALIGDE